jgi:hypothetical protein
MLTAVHEDQAAEIDLLLPRHGDVVMPHSMSTFPSETAFRRVCEATATQFHLQRRKLELLLDRVGYPGTELHGIASGRPSVPRKENGARVVAVADG